VYRRAKKKVGAVIGGVEVKAFGVAVNLAVARPACGTHGLPCEDTDGRHNSASADRGLKRIR
jgi:hypothetical protein